MTVPFDEDAVVAAAELVARAGGRSFEFGFDDENVSMGEPNWWAQATFRGAKIVTERLYPYPHEACEAVARRILDGANCTHCGCTVTLATTTKEALELVESSSFGEQRVREIRQLAPKHQQEEIIKRVSRAEGVCRWTREGKTWRRGCET